MEIDISQMTPEQKLAYENCIKVTLKFIKKYAHKIKHLGVNPQDPETNFKKVI